VTLIGIGYSHSPVAQVAAFIICWGGVDQFVESVTVVVFFEKLPKTTILAVINPY
jgi:hypothetical protein